MKPVPKHLAAKRVPPKQLTKLLLSHKCAPGDTVVLTAFVRDLALAYPHVRIGLDQIHAPDIFKHNPHITIDKSHRTDSDAFLYKAHYGSGLREQKHRTVHFLRYFHDMFEKDTGIHVPVRYPWPDLHLSEVERTVSPMRGRYWVVLPGGKTDMPAKVWRSTAWQNTIDELATNFGLQFVQLGSTSVDCWNPPLRNTLNLVGRTNLRDMLRLIHHADGVICGVTSAMHIAAGLHRPCVVIAGGREAWWWEAYTNENTGFGPHANGTFTVPHRYLHTIGLLDCCQTHGCWNSRVHALDHTPNGRAHTKHVCKYPEDLATIPQPRCLNLITVRHVVEAVLSYYEDGTLQWPLPNTLTPACLPAETSSPTSAVTAPA